MNDVSGASAEADQALVCDQAAARLAPSGFDPSRGEYETEMDRIFEIALTSLHLSDYHEAGARKLYAAGLNNRDGHLTAHMASRVIAAYFAAMAATGAERQAVTRYINNAADAFHEVPIQWPEGPQRQQATAYSMDAVVRYQALADHIHDRAHHAPVGKAETPNPNQDPSHV